MLKLECLITRKAGNLLIIRREIEPSKVHVLGHIRKNVIYIALIEIPYEINSWRPCWMNWPETRGRNRLLMTR